MFFFGIVIFVSPQIKCFPMENKTDVKKIKYAIKSNQTKRKRYKNFW